MEFDCKPIVDVARRIADLSNPTELGLVLGTQVALNVWIVYRIPFLRRTTLFDFTVEIDDQALGAQTGL
jgi:hypothetical protein